jgi:hypothetical protein
MMSRSLHHMWQHSLLQIVLTLFYIVLVTKNKVWSNLKTYEMYLNVIFS